jgi:hypothetical protein
MTREIMLSQGKVALIDDEDFDRVNAFKWSAARMGGTDRLKKTYWYAKRSINVDGKVFTVYLHRFILGLPDGIHVDHIDGDTLNCVKSNLRFASNRQNVWNQRHSRAKSGYRGVHVAKHGFTASVRADGEVRSIGTFESAEFAARVIDEALRHYHGEFAQTNFQDSDPAARKAFTRYLSGERLTSRSFTAARSVLTDEQVCVIRRRYRDGGTPMRVLAEEFGVCNAVISHAISGRTFQHITDPAPIKSDMRRSGSRRELNEEAAA